MTRTDRPAAEFRYVERAFDAASATAHLRFALDAEHFEERITFLSGPATELSPARREALDRVLRHLFLAAGVSYWKAGAPRRVVVESEPLGADDVAFYERLYAHGLAEFAWTNQLEGWGSPDFDVRDAAVSAPVTGLALAGTPLVPVGGGKDSMVTIDALRATGHDPALFVVNEVPAITRALDATGLPRRAVRRRLDPRLMELNEHGALNGHIPITAIVSLIALADAILAGRDTVVMSNERSASVPNFTWAGTDVNHQYSKSLDFERDLRALVARSMSPDLEYFSLLRPFSELRIVRHFARLDALHHVVTSCNRAFALDETRRGSGWCRDCPKCRFVFLALAAFVDRARVVDVFGGDMLADPTQTDGFLALLGIDGPKPLECVGEVEESRAAAQMLSGRSDWAGAPVLVELEARLEPAARVPDDELDRLLATGPEHFVPERYQDALDAVR